MTMQESPVLQQQPITTKRKKSFNEDDHPHHSRRMLGASEARIATEPKGAVGTEDINDHEDNIFPKEAPQGSESSERCPKSKKYAFLTTLKHSSPSHIFRSTTHVPDADLTPPVSPSHLTDPEHRGKDEMSSPSMIKIQTIQIKAATEPAREGHQTALAPESQLNLALPDAKARLPMQDEFENEVQRTHQGLSQIGAKPQTSERQHLWFGNRWAVENPKSQMAYSEASVGRAFNLKSLGGNKCWEVKGPARDTFDRILPKIKEILALCEEDLVAQESRPLAVLVAMYMIGRDEKIAVPTILFSCQSRALRRKAMKFVKRSNLFQNLQGIALAESKETPSSLGSSKEQGYLNPLEQQQVTEVYVMPPRSTESLCGTSIFIPNDKERPSNLTKVATMGGVLQQGNSYFGLTVAHSLLGIYGTQTSLEGSVDFSFDDSDDSEYYEDIVASPDSGRPPFARPYLESNSAPDLKKLGCTRALAFNNDLDYALIEIDLESFKVPNQILLNMNGNVEYRHPKEILQVPARDCGVLVMTGSKGVIKGVMSGIPYLMKMAFGKKFQEVRLVRLENTIEHGDCGSWVIDLESGNLFGVVVSGYPETGTTYIIPAMVILEDIRSRTGFDITLPQSMHHSIQKSIETSYPKSERLTSTGGKALQLEAPNVQPSTQVSAGLEIYRPGRASMEILPFPMAQPWLPDRAIAPPSKRDSNSRPENLVASVSLEPTRPGANYSYEIAKNSTQWGDASSLNASTAGTTRYESSPDAPSKPHLEAPTHFSENKQKHSLLDNMPENLGFLWSIDAIEPLYNDEHPRRYLEVGGKTSNEIYRVWFPPNRAKMFKHHPGKLYRWRMGESWQIDHYPRPKKKFANSSLFFQAQQNNFLAVSQDCTRVDIAHEDHGWAQIGFAHLPGNLSQVMISGEHTCLAAPADGSSWMPQVLPENYNYELSPNLKRPSGPAGGLCGDLSLLVGMAAFSGSAHHAEAIVKQCFGLNKWRRHEFETGIGRNQDRGYLVSIYIDPKAEGITINHLKAFERGAYGPIFEAAPCYDMVPRPPYSTYQAQSLNVPIKTPRSASIYPLAQAPIDVVKQYDDFFADAERFSEEKTMEGT